MAGGALLILYILSALGGSGQYDLTWVAVCILIFMAVVPIVLAIGFTLWAVSRPSAEEK